MADSNTRVLRLVVTGDVAHGSVALRKTERDVEGVQKKVGMLDKAFGSMGTTAIAAVASFGVVQGFKLTVGAASDLNETLSKTKTIFHGNSAAVEKWASDASEKLGMTTQAALDGASSFGNFFAQIGIGLPQATAMSTKLTELATDFASFHNAEPAEAMEALLAATRGEYDSLQRFVPTANAAAIEAQALADTGKATAKELTNAEKATALYNLVLRDAGAAVGDFARTSDGAANQERIFKAQMLESATAIGNVVLPVYRETLGVLTEVGPLYAAGAVGAVLFGNKIGAAFDLAKTAVGVYSLEVREAATKTGPLRAAMSGIQLAAGKAKAGLSALVGTLGGPWGIALAGAAVAMGYFSHRASEQKAKNEALVDSLGDLAKVYGTVGADASAAIAEIVSQNKDLRDLVLNTDKLGVSVDDVVAAVHGERGALDTVNEAYDRRLQAIEGLRGAQGSLSKASSNEREELLRQKEAINSVIEQQIESKAATDAVTESQKENTEAVNFHNAAAKELNAQLTILTPVYEDLGNEEKTAAEKADALKAAWDKLFGAAVNQIEAQESWQAAYDSWGSTLTDLTAKVKEAEGADKKKAEADLANARSLSMKTDAGRSARDAFEELLNQSREMYLADVAGGMSVDEATKKHVKRTGQLQKEADKAGFNKKETQKLIDTYGKVPTQVTTDIKLKGAKDVAQQLLDMSVLQAALKSGKSVDQAARELAENKAWAATRKAMEGKAGGGKVIGGSNSLYDDVPHKLAKDEWVVQADAAQHYGDAFMDDINHKRVPRREATPGRAGGGKATWPMVIDVSKSWAPNKKWVTEKYGGLGAGGGAGMGWQKQMAILRAQFPAIQLISGYRPGAITVTGNRSYHSMGRAVDIPPNMTYFNWIRGNYGKNTKELIFSPAGNRQVWNGKPHVYTGAVRATHWNHVHWAMDNGGVLPPKSTTMVTNATNRREFALTEDKLQNLAGATINIERLEVNVGGAVSRTQAGAIAKDIRDELVRIGRRNGGRNGTDGK